VDGAQGNTKKITDDIAALKPSLFIAVPRVLERIQAGIDKKVPSKPPLETYTTHLKST